MWRPVRVSGLAAACGVLLHAAAWGQRPPEAAQARILEEARRIALNYTGRLPDFICTEEVERVADEGAMGEYSGLNGFTLEVTYFQQKEHYRLISPNTQQSEQAYWSARGVKTFGEFASDLALIFDPKSEADFQWKSTAKVRKRQVEVYSFRVAEAHSRYELEIGKQTKIAGYHGLLYIDAATSRVLRLTTEADVPKGIPVLGVSRTVEYDFVRVAGKEHLLPVKSETTLVEDQHQGEPVGFRNVVTFKNYRKFSAGATVTFDAPPE